MLAGEMRKKLVAKSTKIKTFQLSHGINGLAPLLFSSFYCNASKS